MVCFKQTYSFKFFEDCLLQILPGPLLNTLTHHGSSSPNFSGDLNISGQNNWRELSKKLIFLGGGAMNPNEAMVVVLKDILLWLLGFSFIYIVYIS